MSDRYVPLSVRYGNRRTKLWWHIGGVRARVALRIAPWHNGLEFLLDENHRLTDALKQYEQPEWPRGVHR